MALCEEQNGIQILDIDMKHKCCLVSLSHLQVIFTKDALLDVSMDIEVGCVHLRVKW